MTGDPHSRGGAADKGNWMTVPGGIDHRREGGDQRLLGRLVVFVLWLIAVLLFGLVECSIFWLSAIDGSGCPSGGSLDIFGPTRTGGAASGGALLTAIVSGLSLWLAAGFLALWLRGRGGVHPRARRRLHPGVVTTGVQASGKRSTGVLDLFRLVVRTAAGSSPAVLLERGSRKRPAEQRRAR